MTERRASDESPTGPSGALVGVRVLDFCSFIAGSYGAMMLGDLGADVVKVEPLGGDPSRYWGPFLAGESRLFQGWNRNKRSLSLDLKAAPAHQVVEKLLAGADVVMVNFRPGVAEKLGIGYEDVRAINPEVVYLSSTAFGDRGPYRLRPGYDPVLQTMSGAAKLHERFCGDVHINAIAVSDFQAATLAVAGVCAALYHRERSGEGQKVETSLLHAVMSVQSHAFIEALEVEEDEAAGIYPYKMFATADGPIFVACGTDRFWQLLCEALEREDLAADARFRSNPQRVAAAAELEAVLAPIFRSRASLDWEALLLEKGVPCAAARSSAEFFDDPQVAALGMSRTVEHTKLGKMRVMGVPMEFGRTPGAIQRAAPLLGEHSVEVLEELGFAPGRIEELVASGVVAVAPV
ncbi:MAG: CoA transferase [Thermoanaerobaculia bacterium]|nr:CoA transferase [Thermoanaerobaculia bacterium]